MNYRLKSYILFLFQLVAHISTIVGVIAWGFEGLLISFIVYFLTGCLGMTVTYHRLLSHRSFKTSKFIEYIGTLLGTYGLVGSSIAWVSTHRQHHRKVDTDKDPHSPLHQGFFKVQFLSMFYQIELRLVQDLIRDKFHVFVHKYYFHIHLCIIFLLLIVSPYLLVFAYFAPAVILWHGGSFINTVNHMWGYRNSDTNDSSTNNPITGILMWGEGWHNNHHDKPYRWNFQVKWWEFDMGSIIIRLINR
jgi:fatty-acid desaturase